MAVDTVDLTEDSDISSVKKQLFMVTQTVAAAETSSAEMQRDVIESMKDLRQFFVKLNQNQEGRIATAEGS